ncbi:hypothetical protein AYI69_g6877 [Smittium culicis]|uniref:Uncharacterized protein n=1 Tax=Smittium culicis TaxID=133412 RepID=A0A1R1XVV6_9FUNG|nr:hypothetical protein AYI69_g6877 [Smittium culicis]
MQFAKRIVLIAATAALAIIASTEAQAMVVDCRAFPREIRYLCSWAHGFLSNRRAYRLLYIMSAANIFYLS